MEKVKLIKGDITKLNVDVIVNAANSSLKGGGGVDGAIHRAGGPAILEECKKWTAKHGKLPTGEAIITSGGELPANYVIHTVGPVWNGGDNNEEQLLANAYKNSLELAVKHDLATVAFPNISTGVYGFPKEKAARIAVDSVKNFLTNSDAIGEVTFVCFDDENYKLYDKLLS